MNDAINEISQDTQTLSSAQITASMFTTSPLMYKHCFTSHHKH